jgi:hypothetical protein
VCVCARLRLCLRELPFGFVLVFDFAFLFVFACRPGERQHASRLLLCLQADFQTLFGLTAFVIRCTQVGPKSPCFCRALWPPSCSVRFSTGFKVKPDLELGCSHRVCQVGQSSLDPRYNRDTGEALRFQAISEKQLDLHAVTKDSRDLLAAPVPAQVSSFLHSWRPRPFDRRISRWQSSPGRTSNIC